MKLFAAIILAGCFALTGCSKKCYRCAPCFDESGKCLPPSTRKCNCGPSCKCEQSGCESCVRKSGNN